MGGKLLACCGAFLGDGGVVLNDLRDLLYAYVYLLDAVCLLLRVFRYGLDEACGAVYLLDYLVQSFRCLVCYLIADLNL